VKLDVHRKAANRRQPFHESDPLRGSAEG